MKIKFKNILTIIILLCNMQLIAQKKELGLIIGDSLPVSIIPKMIHSEERTGNTNDYRNKLLIVDFWDRGCSSCIENLPRLEALEKKFGSQIRILPVTNEKEQTILKFWKNNKYTSDLKGASVVEDTLFHNYFKFRYLPHEVWVYNGKVIGITSMEYVDEYNIKRVLSGEQVNWPVKNDFYTFDRSKPLFTLDNKQVNTNSTLIQYAAISDFREKNNSPIWLTGGSGIIRDSIKKTVRTFFLNQPILNTYFFYWWTLVKSKKLVKPVREFQPNQVVWEVRDKTKYFYEKKVGEYSQDWLAKNGICFESLYPDTGQNDQQIHKSVISDLDRLLGLKVRWEKRKEMVLVLVKNTSQNLSKNNVAGSKKRYKIYDVLRYLNEQYSNPYVFNESGDELTEVFLEIGSWTDLFNIKKGLKSAGFELKEEEREVDKFVISETGDSRIVDREMQAMAREKKKGQDSLKEPTLGENLNFLESNKKKPRIIQTSSGLQYKVLKEGKGRNAEVGNRVVLNYEGRLVNGKIFDSSYELGVPVEMKVGGVVKGWSEALQLMNEGAEWELYIPASLAYGTHTGHGKFPPNSTLIFKVELMKILP